MSDQKSFAKAPYYDDYRKDSGFLKVLFKPGYPVQARELNQIQSILQQQVISLGDHMFKEGAIIMPGGVKAYPADFYKIQSITKRTSTEITEATESVGVADVNLNGKVFEAANGLKAVLNLLHHDDSIDVSLASFSYINAGTNGEQVFVHSDLVVFSSTDGGVTTSYEILISDRPDYKTTGYVAKANAGVYYVRGFFVQTSDELMVIDPYNTTIDVKVGFLIIDDIVTASDDSTLYENASGFNNIGVEGADRYAIRLKLSKQNFSYTSQSQNKDFLPMVVIKGGIITQEVTTTNYALIKDEIKKYHKDVYGNYIVSHFMGSVNELSKIIDPVDGLSSVATYGVPVSDVSSEEYAKILTSGIAYNVFDIRSDTESDFCFKCSIQQETEFGVYGFKRGYYYPCKNPQTLMDEMNSRIRLYLGPGKVSLDGEVYECKSNTAIYLKKPTEYEYRNNVNVPINYGNYIYVTECNKLPSIGEKLFFTASNTAVDNITSTFPSYTFNHTRNTVNCFDLIGEALVTGIEFFSGSPGYGWNKHIPCSDALNYWHALAGAGETTAADRVPGEQGVHRGTFSIAGMEPNAERGIYKVYITIPKMYTWEQVNDTTRNIISTAINAQSYIYDRSFEAEPTMDDVKSGTALSQTIDGDKKLNYKTANIVINDFEFMRKQKVPVEFIRGYYTAFQSTAPNSKSEGSRGTVLTKYLIKNDTQPTIQKLNNVVIPRSIDGMDYQHGRIYHHSGNVILVKHLYDITTQQMWSDEKDGVYEALPDGSVGQGGIRTNLALLKSYKNRLYAPGEKLFVKNYSTTAIDVADVEIYSREIFCETANTTRLFSTGRRYLRSLKPTFNINGVDVKMPDTSYTVQRTMYTKVITRSNGDIGIELGLTDPSETFTTFNGTNWSCFLASAGSTTYIEAIPLEIVEGSIEYESANSKVFFKTYMPGAGSGATNTQIMDTATQIGYEVVVTVTIIKTATERSKTRKSSNFICKSYSDKFGYTVPSGLSGTEIDDYIKGASQTYFSSVSLEKADVVKIANIFEIAPPTAKELSELKDEFGSPTTDTRYQKIIKGKVKDAEGNVSNVYVTVKDATLADVEFAYNEYRSQVSAAELGLLVDNAGNIAQPTATKIQNVTSNFSLDDGQRDDLYDFASIKLIKGNPTPVGRVFVGFEYYEHGSGDYFTIDSYSEGAYLIPKFKNESLADFIDFRPVVRSGVRGYIDNLSTACPETSLMCDAEYHLGKVYKVIAYEDRVTSTLMISALEGKSHPTSPESPITPDNAIWLYEVEMKPRVDSLKDVKIKQNKESVKKAVDLANLERRVSNLEYYITLSAKENETLMKKVVDINGVDRFKTGIFVESFDNHENADTESPDYHCSIDSKEGILRPAFIENTVNLELDRANSTNVVIRDNLVTLPYQSVLLDEQLWATRSVNVNPFGLLVFQPKIKLYPSSDDWKDTETIPTKVVNQDLRVPGLDALATQVGVNWGSWTSTWVGEETNINESRTSTTSTSPNGWDGSGIQQTTNTEIKTTTTVTTTLDQVRQGIALSASERTQTVDLGEKVVNVSSIPFIRARPISVIVTGYKPNAFVYSYFDKVNVTGLVVPSPYFDTVITKANYETIDVGKIYSIEQANGTQIQFEILHKRWTNIITDNARLFINILAPNDNSVQLPLGGRVVDTNNNQQICTVNSYESNYVVFKNGNWISPHDLTKRQKDPNYGVARSDTVGDFVGIFYIPNSDALRFRCGTRSFYIADSDTLTKSTVEATTSYTAFGSLVTKQSTFLSTRSDQVLSHTVSDSRTTTSDVSSSVTRNEYKIVEIRAPNPDNRQQMLNAMTAQASAAAAAAAQAARDRQSADAAAAQAARDRQSANAAAAQAEADRQASVAAANQAAADRRAAQAAAATPPVVITNTIIQQPIQQIANVVQVIQPPPPPPPPFVNPLPPPACLACFCFNWCDPIAQTLSLSEPTTITAVEVYFKSKPQAFDGINQVTVEVRPVVNGYPSSDTILAAQTKMPEQVLVDEFGRTPTRFDFDVPAFCKAGDIAIVVKAPNTTEYEVFISQVGEQLIGENGIADKQPTLGSFFVSQNQETWTANQLQDMKYRVYRASYTSGQGVVYLYDDQVDFVGSRLDMVPLKSNQLEVYIPDGGTQYLLRVNHKHHGLFVGDKAELAQLPANKIGDFTSGNYLDLSKLNGVPLDVVDVSVDWYSTYIPAQVVFGVPPQGVINLINPILSARNIHYNMVMLNGTYINQPNTNIDIEMRAVSGRSYHGRGQTPYIKQQWKKTEFRKEEYLPVPMMVASETNRRYRFDGTKTSFWDGQSLVYRVSLSTLNDRITPVLDIERMSSIVVGNIVNNPQDVKPSMFPEIGYIGDLETGFTSDFVSELEPSGGSVLNKYITKPIKTQFPNVGLNVYATYVQSEPNQVRFFIRTSNSSDRSSFEAIPWTELVINNAKVGTKMEVDMVYEAPAEFTAYQIKITLAATNSSSVPIVDDFRCTALGT